MGHRNFATEISCGLFVSNLLVPDMNRNGEKSFPTVFILEEGSWLNRYFLLTLRIVCFKNFLPTIIQLAGEANHRLCVFTKALDIVGAIRAVGNVATVGYSIG
jgi:hypothetical protein